MMTPETELRQALARAEADRERAGDTIRHYRAMVWILAGFDPKRVQAAARQAEDSLTETGRHDLPIPRPTTSPNTGAGR